MTRKYLEYSSGASNKFWAIELNGTSHTVTFGRIGTDGQSQVKKFTTNELAKKSFDKLLSQKFDLRAKKTAFILSAIGDKCRLLRLYSESSVFLGATYFSFGRPGICLRKALYSSSSASLVKFQSGTSTWKSICCFAGVA